MIKKKKKNYLHIKKIWDIKAMKALRGKGHTIMQFLSPRSPPYNFFEKFIEKTMKKEEI